MHLSIQGVGKRYAGGVQALADFSLDVGPGVLGLLGPNGAGKSTLMRILATITRPTEGRVLWNGQDIAGAPDTLRRVLGYLPQDFGVYPHLNASEFLHYLAAVKGVPSAMARGRVPELLALVQLTEVATRPLGGYSGGMRQRVGIAQALLNDPRRLFEALYLTLACVGPFQRTAGLDFMGTALPGPPSPQPMIWLGLAVGLLAVSAILRRRRLRSGLL